jgi:hypothetical protein
MEIKRSGILTGAVGLITETHQMKKSLALEKTWFYLLRIFKKSLAALQI